MTSPRPRLVFATAALMVAALAASLVPSGLQRRPLASAEAAPRNVIVVIGDGMGPAQMRLGRRMNGAPLFVDGIPWQTRGTLDPSSLDGITDSAAAGTALASGVETHNDWVGTVPTPDGYAIAETALERAEAEGKATGLVTNSYLTDATPAAFAAHVTDRSLREEIATQMAAQGIEFLAGGGLKRGSVGPLLGQPGVTYVRSAAELAAYDGAGPVYGLFAGWNMTYALDREEEDPLGTQPTLPQMTAAALDTLSRDPDGFFLMVEGDLIDWRGHGRDAAGLGREMLETDAAARTVWTWAKDRTDTLVVFTADHETGDLAVRSTTDVAALRQQRATIHFMWGRIARGAFIGGTLRTYAGISPTTTEIDRIKRCGELGIADVLADRWRVSWGTSRCRADGEHTPTPVVVWAWGPGSAGFAGTAVDNEIVGRRLLDLLGA